MILLHLLADVRLLLQGSSGEDPVRLAVTLGCTLLALLAASSVLNCGAGCSSAEAARQRGERDAAARRYTEAMNAKSKARWESGKESAGRSGAGEAPAFLHPRAAATLAAGGRAATVAAGLGRTLQTRHLHGHHAEPDDFGRRAPAKNNYGCTLQYIRADWTRSF